MLKAYLLPLYSWFTGHIYRMCWKDKKTHSLTLSHTHTHSFKVVYYLGGVSLWFRGIREGISMPMNCSDRVRLPPLLLLSLSSLAPLLILHFKHTYSGCSPRWAVFHISNIMAVTAPAAASAHYYCLEFVTPVKTPIQCSAILNSSWISAQSHK